MWVPSKCYDTEFHRSQAGLIYRGESVIGPPAAARSRAREQAADRLVRDGGIAGQHTQQHGEPIGSRAFEVQQDRLPAADTAGPTGQVAERFLADVVADLASQLQRLSSSKPSVSSMLPYSSLQSRCHTATVKSPEVRCQDHRDGAPIGATGGEGAGV